jgi:transcriptional regulator with XRE-family HTH domain
VGGRCPRRDVSRPFLAANQRNLFATQTEAPAVAVAWFPFAITIRSRGVLSGIASPLSACVSLRMVKNPHQLDVRMTDQQTTNSLHRFLDGDPEAQPRGIEDSASDLGARIADARTAGGRTQTDIANQLGVKVSTVDKWERGVASPRSNRLMALAGILGVSLSWLIVGHGDEPTAPDDLDDIRVALGRVHAQLTDSLNEVDVLLARLGNARAAD